MVGAGDLDTPTGQMPAAAESRRSGGENPTSRLSSTLALTASKSERQEQAGGMVHHYLHRSITTESHLTLIQSTPGYTEL